ncbi:sarcosine oxidase [Pseudorhizobium endolithicum]|uniref:Sarcosine oxidase n=1 Tax=Pseudorhizobium endolithicum TaxID=1191678 RepID=A0ABN7JL96_9HYPH|nr:(2Fe-2S)-binding protein [Pseudorhizobium endolithicum]CAD7035666.1 sarcosine oxidase [Pseudorhizobium endolithicum]
MFQFLEPHAPLVTLKVDGRDVQVPAGASVALALLANTGGPTRYSPAAHGPRAPFCLMGVCHECTVEIEGQGITRSCLSTVCPGMRISTETGNGTL